MTVILLVGVVRNIEMYFLVMVRKTLIHLIVYYMTSVQLS
jgi:hypothetical protein